MAIAVTQRHVEDVIDRAIAPVSVRVSAGEQLQFVAIGSAERSQNVVLTFRDYEEIAERICVALAESGYLASSSDIPIVFHKIMQGWSLKLKSKSKTCLAGSIPNNIYSLLQNSGVLKEFVSNSVLIPA